MYNTLNHYLLRKTEEVHDRDWNVLYFHVILKLLIITFYP